MHVTGDERIDLKNHLNRAGLLDIELTVTKGGFRMFADSYDRQPERVKQALELLMEEDVLLTDRLPIGETQHVFLEPGPRVSEPAVKWHSVSSTVYTLMEAGGFYRGEPRMKNRATIQIHVDQDAGGEERAQTLAEEIRRILQERQVIV
jgi:hypothetical protein